MFNLGLSADEKKAFTAALRGEGDPATTGVDTPDPIPTPSGDPGDPASDPGTPDPGTASPMQFVTANVRHGMSLSNKRDAMKKVRDLGSVIMWQEMGGTQSSRSLLDELFPSSAWHHVPPINNKGTRISVKKSIWTVEQGHAYLMHGDPFNLPGTRETYTTVALVTSKNGGIQFLVCDAHFIPHAWSNAQVAHKQWHKDAWNKHYNKFQSIVLDARSKGITVIGGGDWNRTSVDPFNSDQVWFHHHSLDYLFGLHSAGGATFNEVSSQQVQTGSDHLALVAKLTWTKGSNPIKHSYSWPGL